MIGASSISKPLLYVYRGACQEIFALKEPTKSSLPLVSPVGAGMTTASSATFSGETNFTHSYAAFDGGEHCAW